ncbi:hypothetical protein UAW_03058 [Enterococcus haemoperoxidus ATCC BAA-382]|uniref:Uncharacterized protein n=2 Tax=Enterococcus haemoperoxidus TaxID=155618 RepID=R2QB16_9ENTE|nr:hypothetical protein [Enterococcus haemoperoxidus]EOH92393.1 hypothetical protein UAW_03058 [Enterococcus haemoperoxidus ATCC BAA-382]EOT61759.1 hypothetical protein I583_00741 [Enterococcus haemoperoxidus ATCC BAA-382]
MYKSKEYYLMLNDCSRGIINQSFSSENESLNKQYNFIQDLDSWMEVLNNRPECNLYKNAFTEYQHAINLSCQGMYRQAFVALRFFLEHTFAAVYFSVRELEFKLWQESLQDIFWSKLNDEDNGVLSSTMSKIYSPLLVEEQEKYRKRAKSVYRKCSEYTHGNFATYSTLKEHISFDSSILNLLSKRVEESQEIIIFILFSRFWGSLDRNEKISLESTLNDTISSNSAVQNILSDSQGD